jgi:hypothetical protein
MKQIMADLMAWVSTQAGKIRAPFVWAMEKSGIGPASNAAIGSFQEDFGTGDPTANRSGGPITADGTYVVGEDGPELITPSRNGYVHPNPSTRASSLTGMLGGMADRAQAQAAALVPRAVEIANISIAPRLSFPGAQAADAETIARQVMARIERETAGMLRGVMADIGLKG